MEEDRGWNEKGGDENKKKFRKEERKIKKRNKSGGDKQSKEFYEE